MKVVAITADVRRLIVLFLAIPTPVWAQALSPDPKSRTNPPHILSRLEGRIRLDGLSNEAAWQSVAPLPLVTQVPAFGGEPSERTEIRIAYNSQFLFVAGRMYDHPDSIMATSFKRDLFSPSDDNFTVILDTYNDDETALVFITGPTGFRTDFAVFNDAEGESPINVSWNTFWDVAVTQNDEGWFAEMRIPFSGIGFQDRDGRVEMGLIVDRYIARKNEVASFPAIRREFGPWSWCKPSLARDVVVSGVHGRSPLYVTPYLLTGLDRAFELNQPRTDYQSIDKSVLDAGLDLKYGLSSNLTLDLTVNTDFA